MNMTTEQAINRILENQIPVKSDIEYLLSIEDKEDIAILFEAARVCRDQYCGKKVHLRGIVEFSNYCSQDCIYCGIRKSKDEVARYRLSFEEIIGAVQTIYDAGVKTVVLQSGEDPYYDTGMISKIIKEIKISFGLAITLSLGEREFIEYDVWRQNGADRYLLKHETANPKIYSALHRGQQLEQRLEHLGYLQQLGYQIGSGNIIGIPEQTLADIADDIILCTKYELDMASFSPFIPAAGTPLGDWEKANVLLTLKTMAAARLALKNTHIPATTALATLDARGREKGILCGANVVMPSFTPAAVKPKYEIYDNKRCITEDAAACMPCLKARIESCNVSIDEGFGHSLKLAPIC